MGAAAPRSMSAMILKYHGISRRFFPMSTLSYPCDDPTLTPVHPRKQETPGFTPGLGLVLATVYRLYSCHDTTQDNPRHTPSITQATTNSEAYPETVIVKSFKIITGLTLTLKHKNFLG